MKEKPVTPYQRLMNQFSAWANECIMRGRISMWRYPKDKLSETNWRLADLWERVAAADQLGYDVQLSAKDDGLHVEYVKKLPKRPWNV
jgi:hypothetical protein